MFQWLNNQLLRMEWLYNLVKRLVEDGLGLSLQTRWEAVYTFSSTML